MKIIRLATQQKKAEVDLKNWDSTQLRRIAEALNKLSPDKITNEISKLNTSIKDVSSKLGAISRSIEKVASAIK